jgi:hypothetical protein
MRTKLLVGKFLYYLYSTRTMKVLSNADLIACFYNKICTIVSELLFENHKVQS